MPKKSCVNQAHKRRVIGVPLLFFDGFVVIAFLSNLALDGVCGYVNLIQLQSNTDCPTGNSEIWL